MYVFDGTMGTQTAKIVNPHPADSTGFGAAVASVGPNVLVGSPDDNTAGIGAGAAFLFGPTGLLLESFAQPDGGGGNFGASVAGTQNTALIGAPGAFLATRDAGAAYLFDADPASPTFGRALAAEQESTPTTGDNFGAAVGFDIGAVIVGAAGALGSGITGADAVDVYQQGATISLSSGVTYATLAPNDSVILGATYLDANTSANLKATINWGDGSAPTVVDLPAGSYGFAAPHDYGVDPASGYYAISVTLSDSFGESAFAQTTITMSNPAPEFAAPGLVLSPSSIVEGGTVTLSGTIKSPGGSDTNVVSINWGDGSAPTPISLAPGMDDFSTSHTYGANPSGVSSQIYTINASVTDQTTQKAGFDTASATVNKVAPQFTAADLDLSSANVDEGDTVTLNGTFLDPDSASTYTVAIDWGDGSAPTPLSEQIGQVAASPTIPGLYSYSTTHQYLHNPPGQPTGGSYDIHVSVSDSVNTTSAETLIVVNRVPPDVQITSVVDMASGTITASAEVTDHDPTATDSVSWSLSEDGISIGAFLGSIYTFPIPNPLGMLVATATATDSDGAVGSDSAQLVVIYQTDASVVINSSGTTVSQGGVPVSTTNSAGAGQVTALVTGSNDVIDASSDASPVELVSSGFDNTLIGGSGDDLLVASTGANSLVGGGGDDTLVSNGGDDTLVGGSGNADFKINPGHDPLVIGAAGSNTLDFSISTVPITINLGLEGGQEQFVDPENDEVTLVGHFNEYISSPNGDNVTANDGNDLIYALTGNTTITGGAGKDSIVGGSGNDIIYALTGNTTITGGSGNESITGGSGNDIIYALTGNTTITGGSGNESITGGSGNDIIYALTGNTTITGGSGHESITGGSGNDIIYALTGNTTITGGSGHETIVGGSGNDIIYALTGNTTITGGSGNESITGRFRQ